MTTIILLIWGAAFLIGSLTMLVLAIKAKNPILLLITLTKLITAFTGFVTVMGPGISKLIVEAMKALFGN